MSRSGVKKPRTGNAAKELPSTAKASAQDPLTELQSIDLSLSELAESQRLLNRIGKDLTALSSRDNLLRRALLYLRSDLGHEDAAIVLNDPDGEPNAVPSDSSEADPYRTAITDGNQSFGHIEIPIKAAVPLTDVVREGLKTFADFLAVGLKNSKQLEEVRALASVDPLTGIMNRRRLFEVGSKQMHRTRSTGLIVFDIDRLKVINDTYGHLAGDAFVKLVAERAEESIRKTDVLARFGGDEFAILLPGTGPEPLEAIAERIRRNIESAIVEWQGHSIRSTVSVGFACIDGAVDLNNLLSCADEALYAAKNAGRNQVRPMLPSDKSE